MATMIDERALDERLARLEAARSLEPARGLAPGMR